MKKQFEVRARLVIYLEQADLNALTALAREDGRTLVEWARGLLIERLAPAVPLEVRYTQRASITAPELQEELDKHARLAREGVCPHGKRAGAVCGKCDPKMGYPTLR
jgi:hypothetical protein